MSSPGSSETWRATVPERALHNALALNLVVRFLLHGIELVDWLPRFRHDFLVLWQFRFPPNAGIGGIFSRGLGGHCDKLTAPVVVTQD